MNIKVKIAIASLGTAALIGAVVPSVSASKPDRQHHNGFYCDPLVTNGNHWGWECTGTVPTPVVTATPEPTTTPEPTSTPAPEVTSTPTPPVATATPSPEKPGNPGSQAVGCWVDGCPVRPTPGPVVSLLPPAVFVPGAPILIPAGDLPAPTPIITPLPPKSGSGGYAESEGSNKAVIVVIVAFATLGGFFLGRTKLD